MSCFPQNINESILRYSEIRHLDRKKCTPGHRTPEYWTQSRWTSCRAFCQGIKLFRLLEQSTTVGGRFLAGLGCLQKCFPIHFLHRNMKVLQQARSEMNHNITTFDNQKENQKVLISEWTSNLIKLWESIWFDLFDTIFFYKFYSYNY